MKEEFKDEISNFILSTIELMIPLIVFHEIGHIIYQLSFGIPIDFGYDPVRGGLSTAPKNFYVGRPLLFVGSTFLAFVFSFLTYPLFSRRGLWERITQNKTLSIIFWTILILLLGLHDITESIILARLYL